MKQSGVTLLELLVTLTILTILASVALPFTKVSSKRTKEIELRQNLRVIRAAIDTFRLEWSRDGDTLTGPACVKNRLSCKDVTGPFGYPKSLDVLLGVKLRTASQRTWNGDQAVPAIDSCGPHDRSRRLAHALLSRSPQHQRLVRRRRVRCHESESRACAGWDQV